MKQDDTPDSSGQAARSYSHGIGPDEDVLHSVPLPGWSVFDALLISWHDHPEAETSGGAFVDTPIARLQRHRRRGIIAIAALFLLSALNRVYYYISSPSSGQMDPLSTPSVSGRFSWFFQRDPTVTPFSALTNINTPPVTDYPLSPAYYATLYNASSTPARLQPPQARMAMLQAIVKSRSSSYNPANFILDHETIMSHVKTGGDPIDLITRNKATSPEHEFVLHPHIVSAVIVHSPDYDISSTQLVVTMASKYPFIREIIIWNNDIALYIDEHIIELPTIEELGFSPPSLRVINSPSSFAPLSSPIHRRLPASRAKHLACGLASKAVCLFLSPSLLPIHLDSLYASFLSTAPAFSQIVSIVNAGDYCHLAHLRFENDAVDLHAGLVQSGISKSANSDLSARDAEMQETMVRRTLSKRFMRQMDTLTPKMYGEEAEIYWSLWTNTMPKLLTAPALPIHNNELVPPSQASVTQIQTARDIMTLHAVRSLFSTLSARDPFLSPDPFPIAPSPSLDPGRAPCHDDRCIFETNISPFTRAPSDLVFHQRTPAISKKAKLGKKDAVSPNQEARSVRKPTSSVFNPFTHIGSIDDYRASWHDLSDSTIVGGFPTSAGEFQRTSNWYLAVNGRHPSLKTLQNNSTSCWLTPGSIDKGAFFGLSFLGPRPAHNVKMIGSANLGNIVGRGQEDLTAESWEVWTKQDEGDRKDREPREEKSEWSRRALKGKVLSTRIGDSSLYVHSFALAPLVATQSPLQASNDKYVEARSNSDIAEQDEQSEVADQILRKREMPLREKELHDTIADDIYDRSKDPLPLESTDMSGLPGAAPLTGIRFISRDRKSQPVRFCGFDIDGWIV